MSNCMYCGQTPAVCKCNSTLGIILRFNNLGQRYTLHAEPRDATKTVVSTRGKHLTINIPLREMLEYWFNWQMKGMFIQQAFKSLSSEEREFLMSGITPDEWAEMFKEPAE